MTAPSGTISGAIQLTKTITIPISAITLPLPPGNFSLGYTAPDKTKPTIFGDLDDMLTALTTQFNIDTSGVKSMMPASLLNLSIALISINVVLVNKVVTSWQFEILVGSESPPGTFVSSWTPFPDVLPNFALVNVDIGVSKAA